MNPTTDARGRGTRILLGILPAAVLLAAATAVPGQASSQSLGEAAPRAAAAAPVAEDTAAGVVAPGSRLWVEGTSTLRSYRCATGVFGGTIELDPDRLRMGIAGLDGAVKAVDLRIPVRRLDCDNDTMNSHMWDALKAGDHDAVRFRMERYALEAPSGPGVTVELQGELTIAGTPRPVTLELQATELPDGGLRVEGSTGFPMTDFGVRPPRLMLGTLRVHDPVTVGFDLVLTLDPGAR